MQELEAMNVLLRAIGSSPVNSLETPHPDAANAKATLKRVRLQAQKRGWWFNVDYNVTLQPDENGEIAIPSYISSLQMVDRSYVKRGDKLYNKVQQTYYIGCEVVVSRMIRMLDWDELPESMQDYIMYFAASLFIRDELEDPNKEQSFQQSAGMAMLDVKKQDLEEGQYNMFDRPEFRKNRSGVRPYRQTLEHRILK